MGHWGYLFTAFTSIAEFLAKQDLKKKEEEIKGVDQKKTKTMEIKIQQQGDSQGKNSNKENNFNAACKKCFPV